MRTLLIAVSAFVACIGYATAQGGQHAPIQPDRTVGAAEVYYFREKNRTRAQVRVYPYGGPNDLGGDREALSMDVIFETDGAKVAQPRYIHIAFSSYSPSGPKYRKERDLTIFMQETKGFSSTTFRTRLLNSSSSPSGGAVEVLVSSAIDYTKFLSLLSAHTVTFTLGKTQFTLRKEDIKALNDLNNAIEK